MVRVVGQIRDYEGNRHILAFEVFPLEDFNQLTHHLLDVMLTHLRHTQGPVPVRTLLTISSLHSFLLYYACFLLKVDFNDFSIKLNANLTTVVVAMMDSRAQRHQRWRTISPLLLPWAAWVAASVCLRWAVEPV